MEEERFNIGRNIVVKKNLKSNFKCLEAAYITLKTDPEKSIIQKQCTFSNEFSFKSFYCVLNELRYYG